MFSLLLKDLISDFILYESCGRKIESVTRFWVSEIINDDVMASARIYQARLQMIKSYAQQSLA